MNTDKTTAELLAEFLETHALETWNDHNGLLASDNGDGDIDGSPEPEVERERCYAPSSRE